MFDIGKITSYDKGIKYTVKILSGLEVNYLERYQDRYQSVWWARTPDEDIVKTSGQDIEIVIRFSRDIITTIKKTKDTESVRENFEITIYNAIIQALFYEWITNNKIEIELREKKKNDDVLEKSDNLLRAYVTFSPYVPPQPPAIRFDYDKDELFERDEMLWTQHGILEELLKNYQSGLTRDNLKEIIFFDRDVIQTALNGFKENNCIKIGGDYIKITDKGEDVKKQLYNKIELRRQEIKSQQQPKAQMGFQPPS